MRANHVKRRLKGGQTSVGTWLSLPCAPAARYIAQLGFDWLTVDTEHQPISIETAAAMFGAIAGAGPAPLARVPWNHGQNIKRVLDCGAWGVVVPMVETRAEAEEAVRAARYPPLGVRSVGGSLHALSFGTDAASYYAQANDEVLVVLQMESARAVENADDLLGAPGIDAVFIGPNDLMASMGMTPGMESDDQRFVEAIEHIRVTARKHGVASGIHVAGHEAARRRIAEGFQFIALASDLRFVLSAARAELAATGFHRGDGGGEVVRY